jgi:catechol-2,3-dioxygenase
MKTIKLTFLFLMLNMVCMGMGFPTLFAGNEGKARECRRKTEHKEIPAEIIPRTAVVQEAQTVRQSPRYEWVAIPAESRLGRIVLKVFDTKGNLLFSRNVGLDDVFDDALTDKHLPVGSVFVMFYQNTAYYFKENE